MEKMTPGRLPTSMLMNKPQYTFLTDGAKKYIKKPDI